MGPRDLVWVFEALGNIGSHPVTRPIGGFGDGYAMAITERAALSNCHAACGAGSVAEPSPPASLGGPSTLR
jgi:hypothetical protein